MDELYLVSPAPAHEAAVMALRDELLAGGEAFDGCAGLEDCADYARWLAFESRLSAKYREGYTPSHVFLALRRRDDMLVGIADFRWPLTEFLLQYGGAVGYTVRPSLRRRGYGVKLLRLLLPRCRALGASRVLLCCDKDNIASAHTILAGGGVLENEVADRAGLTTSGVIQRYWIDL